MKIDMTRSEYLLKFLYEDISMEELKKVFPSSYEMIYCTYNILEDMGIKNKDIVSADADSENMSIGVEFMNKDIPKLIKKKENTYSEMAGMRDNYFTLKIKVKGKFIFFEFTKA